MSRHSFGPAIGISLSTDAPDAGKYRRAVEAHRALVRDLLPDDPEAKLEGLHGLLLGGGGDICPRCYGYSPQAKLKHPDMRRDEFELQLTRAALAGELPVLGICRGAQVLGVALGGTLVQDIPTEIGSAVQHSNGAFHFIRLAEDSLLHRILDQREVYVNSSHHQANLSLGDGVRAVAWSPDGVIEAIEVEERKFVLGVQWHPERMENDDVQVRLFHDFVAAAREHAGAKPHLPGSESR